MSWPLPALGPRARGDQVSVPPPVESPGPTGIGAALAPRGRTPCDLIGRFQVSRSGRALHVTIQMMCKQALSCVFFFLV